MADFKNADVHRQYDEKIAKIESVLNSPVVDKKYLWNKVVKNYVTKMKQIRRVLKPQTFKDDNNAENFQIEVAEKICDRINIFLKTCANHEFQIALVGTIKAGKSTLINALLNYELALTNVTPETDALTKFRKADKDYLEITFYNEVEWKNLWNSATNPIKFKTDETDSESENIDDTSNNVFLEDYNKLNADDAKKIWLNHKPEHFDCDDHEDLKQKIAEATSSKSPKHYFVKEVTVGLKDCNLPRDVVLVDTPGLNDVIEYRSNITRNYINKANAVFACIKSDKFEADGGEGGIYQTLVRIFENSREHPEKIYILTTQLDTLKHHEDDWKKQRVEWINTLKGKIFYDNVVLADKNLMPVSAWLYTLLQDYKKILDDYDENLDEKDEKVIRYWDLLNTVGKWKISESRIEKIFEKLQTATNIKILEKSLETEILPERDKFLISDIKKRYENCCKTIRDTMKKISAKQNELIADSQKSIEEIRVKRHDKEIELKKAEADKLELGKLIKDLQKLTKEHIDEVKEKIRNISAKGKGGE